MKLDILILAAHPDDAELGCAGTIAKYTRMGKKAGVIDLTRGELGTRGTAGLRTEEAAAAAEILGLSVRENMDFPDGFFENNRENQLALIKKIRQYQPDIILANAPHDRHPDHGRGGSLAYDAYFLSGLRKIETELEGKPQEAWRPGLFLHYIQDRMLRPDILVDISEVIQVKEAAIRAFKSQFHSPDYASNEPETYISRPAFMEAIMGRSAEWGKTLGTAYAEGFVSPRLLGVKDLFSLL
ncbi:bacillithiol biosynthesis deacetylase BshB1 [Anseongella ginsenosidimutans]|uniref:Bacillithiol biosynthesis deacetylase BshB1 n=1 Tax=Anseongella ginsenosidimutans TaxID=496056 RepID=A0A4R3KTP2_9SPHI|nr:bacillithiol biosynthesis deacetylase BshB1 [Anseongella ginsenosidimutans]QEC53273.1 bacillithiol biosynthesis deacetylase BshB1 [Anseongella ginsenosidimutans]TCS88143.1 bacillithiol biosynthesis deacetylase BshB1 [Anseongella ginsenosidimutans]